MFKQELWTESKDQILQWVVPLACIKHLSLTEKKSSFLFQFALSSDLDSCPASNLEQILHVPIDCFALDSFYTQWISAWDIDWAFVA